MEKLVKLILVLILILVAVQYGRPWFERVLGEQGVGPLGGGGSDAMRCVQLVERANGAFADQVRRHGTPPVNVERWGGSMRLTEGQVSQARSECTCNEEACRTASRALSELSSLMSSFDSAIRGGGPPPLNSARAQESIVTLLEQARREAR